MLIQQRRIISVNGKLAEISTGLNADHSLFSAAIAIDGVTAMGEGITEEQSIKNLRASCMELDKKQ